MAQIEPMDIETDYEDKENSIQHSNVLAKTPCTEKGYEELDVSELSMKLRYSITPASSPMSKSFTSSCRDNTTNDNNKNDYILCNNNLTNSLNSTLVNYDNKLSKTNPLQPLSTDLLNGNNPLVRRSLDTFTVDSIAAITVNENHGDDHLSLPSTSSSATHTPEATTPTKDLPKDGGSPIMRGLKSVFSIFRSSQSPIPPGDTFSVQQNLSPILDSPGEVIQSKQLVSTPIANKKAVTNRNSPLKDSVVFKDDLEKELQWKEESTIIFKDEKIPIHKLFAQQPPLNYLETSQNTGSDEDNIDMQYMDISQNKSLVCEKTITNYGVEITTDIAEILSAVESDGEFVDCETTLTKNEMDISEVGINDVIDVEPLNVPSKIIESCNILEPHQLEHVNTLNGTASSEFVSNLEVIKTDDATSECTTHNQSCREHHVIDPCGKCNDDMTSVVCLPDIVTMPVFVNALTSSTLLTKHVDYAPNTKENISEECKSNDVIEVIGTENISKVFTEHVNNDVPITESNEQTISRAEKNINKNAKIKIEKDALDIGTIKTDLEIIRIVAKPENIADINMEEYNLDKIKPEESKVTNNLLSKLNCEKLHDNLLEQVLIEKSDVHFTNTKNNSNQILPSDNTCDKEFIKQDNIINNDIEKHTNNVISSIRTEDLIECEMMPNKDFCLNKNEQCNELSNIAVATEEICMISNLNAQIKVFETLNITSENNNISAGIPLASDSEFEQENASFKHIFHEETTNLSSSLLSNNTIDLGKDTDRKLESEIVDQIIDKTTNERSQYIGKVNKEKENFDIQNNESATINLEGISTFDIHSQNYEDHKYSCNVDANRNMTVEISETNVSKNKDVNCNMTEYLNDNNATILNSKFELNDTININTEQCNTITFQEQSECPAISNNVLDNQSKIDYDEEIVTSASSSPYVSVTKLAIDSINQDTLILEHIDMENPLVTKTNITTSPPISPKHSNKSYNFSFEDIVDPFATKTKIRESPTPESPKQQTMQTITQDNKSNKKNYVQKREFQRNKRKSQTQRKSFSTSKNFNRIADTIVNDDDNKQELDCNNETSSAVECQDKKETKIKDFHKINNTMQIMDDSMPKDVEIVDYVENSCKTINMLQHVPADERECAKNTFSMEFITTPPEIITENILALPSIFKTSCDKHISKSASKFSPPSVSEVPNDNEEAIKSFIVTEQSNQTNIIESQEVANECSPFLSENTNGNHTVQDIGEFREVAKECFTNISIASCASDTTDVIHTVKEVHTEDEDTIEGPFLEADGDFDCINVLKDIASDKDMMQFDMTSALKKDDDNGELFIDAEAFEFLLNQNKSTVIADSGKESLFLKFDPLYAKRVSSDDVLAALKLKKIQCTPKKIALLVNVDDNNESPSSSKPDVNSEESKEELDVLLTTKPMMVVNPAINPIVVPRKISTPKLNRHSLTFTSPAIAVIDRLLSLSGNTSFSEPNTSLPQSSREHYETDIAITQVREMLAEKEIHVHNLQSESKELKDRLSSLEAQMKSLETESEQRLNKISDLNERLNEKTKINKSMAVVVEEYERTIASLIAEMEQEKKDNSEERMRLVKERDEQSAHLASMEISFNDLHSKYEKSKQIILSMKANTDSYKKSIQEFEDSLIEMQKNYEILKQHATSKLNNANQELEKFNRAHESEVLKLNAMIKRKEMHITSLEETLTQKTKANEELTAICDELISKVG